MDDFGFTFHDKKTFEVKVPVEDTSKLDTLKKMIMPLLNNLKSNPDKDIINWPAKQRIQSIDDFIDKMNKL
jgi:hypothetical protein